MRRTIRQVFLGIIGAPGRSILSVVILFILMTPFMTCVSIWTSTQKELLEAKALKGNEVMLVTDFLSRTEEYAVLESTEGGPYIAQELCEKILGSRYVSNYNYYLLTTAASEIEPVAMESGSYVVLKQNDADSRKYIYKLYGCRRPDLQSEFKSGKLKLVSGHFFGSGNKAPLNSVVVSRELAEENGLGVGSTFVIEDVSLKIKQEVIITGIFDIGESDYQDSSYLTFANSIIAPVEIAKRLERSRNPGLPEGILTYASFYLDDPEHYEEFIAETASQNINLDGYRLELDDGEYRYATGPLYDVEILSKILIWVLLALGMVYMILKALFAVKRRKQEICLLMINGMSKKQILARFTAEAVLLCLVSLAAAGFAGAAAAPSAADIIMKERVKSAGVVETITETVFVSGDYYPSSGSSIAVQLKPDTGWSLIDKIDIETDVNNILLFASAGLLMLLCQLCAIAPGIYRDGPGLLEQKD